MATWKAPAFLDALKTRLEARAALAGVEVHVASMGENIGPEAITCYGVEGTQDWAALGQERKKDGFTVHATIEIVKAGAGDAVAKTARDRAEAILAEVEAEMKNAFTTVAGSQITALNLSKIDLHQGANPTGRWALISFAIDVEIRI